MNNALKIKIVLMMRIVQKMKVINHKLKQKKVNLYI